ASGAWTPSRRRWRFGKLNLGCRPWPPVAAQLGPSAACRRSFALPRPCLSFAGLLAAKSVADHVHPLGGRDRVLFRLFHQLADDRIAIDIAVVPHAAGAVVE